jgi:hypothetical protein
MIVNLLFPAKIIERKRETFANERIKFIHFNDNNSISNRAISNNSSNGSNSDNSNKLPQRYYQPQQQQPVGLMLLNFYGRNLLMY